MYEFDNEGYENEEMDAQRTFHTPYVLQWMNEMREHPTKLSSTQEAFLDDLAVMIVGKGFAVSRHSLADSELLVSKVEQWFTKWEKQIHPEGGEYDPDLESLLEDFFMQDEFSRFDHVVHLGVCTICQQDNRDVDTVHDIDKDQIAHLCHYGCDDIRSQAQGDEYDRWMMEE